MQKNIKVLVVEPNKLPYEKVIKNNLEEKQKIVAGLIEYVSLDNNSLLVYNEEGKILGIEPNRIVGRDIIAGTFFIVGDSLGIGEDVSLNENQIERFKNQFGKDSIFEMNLKLFKLMRKKFRNVGGRIYA